MSATDLASAQHSLVTLDQLRSAGMGRGAIQRLVERGQLERLEPRLLRVRGSAETWEQRVLGACLSVGRHAVACRRTATVLWGLLDLDQPPIEVAVPRPRSPQWVSARVFRSTDIIGAHRTEVRGIPVTTVPRTLVDLGAVTSPWTVEQAVDRAVVRRLTTVCELEAILDNVARQGRRGVGALRRALGGLAEGPESILEMKLLRIILRSTLPTPEVQYEVRVEGRCVARLDLAYPDARLGIEADGREPHSLADTFTRDRDRQAMLEDLGWRLLRFTWHHVTRRQEHVLARIRSVLQSRVS